MSSNKHAAEAYRQSSIENAPAIKIVRMLYDGAIRFIDRALSVEVDDPNFGTWIMRSDAIVVELRCSLEKDIAPELGEDLERLYLFCEDCLSRALIDRKHDPLVEAKGVLVKLLEAWREVEVETTGPR